MILSLLSGVALFLFGMSLMGDGLKMVAGNKLEAFLYRMTNTPLKGVALGTGVTSVIQSSSATTVMVIGFVNSGMMKLKQAIGIIMGANIGTSITGWILCLSYIDGKNGIAKILSTATISAVVAIIGIILRMACKRSVHKNIGNIMLGFAILMTGMQTMSGAVSPLKDSPTFTNMLTMFSNPLIGILVGIAFTAVLQSASATVGVLQALSVTGILTFSSAFPIVLGIGVGAACPVLISAIGANKNGKRTALVYLINDLFGLILWSVIFYTVNAVVHFGFMDMIMSPVAIALLNTVFRVATVCVLFPFIPKIEQLVCWLVKDSAEELEDEADFDLLEERLLNYPALAIGQCHRAMSGMARKLRKNVNRAMNLLNEYQQDKFDKVQRKENLIDKYESRLGQYLMKLTKHEMNSAQTRQASLYLHTINDFERIGDHASYIAYMSSEMHDNHTNFSQEAWDGTEREKIISYCKEHQLSNIIVKDKWIDPKYVPYVLSKSYLNILNYLSSDFAKNGISSSKMFQYMAAGKPIVCNINIYDCPISKNRIGIAREYTSSADYAEEILKILDLPEGEYALMCDRARLAAKEFDYKFLAKKMVDVINSI